MLKACVCVLALSSTAFSGDLFPLAPGNHWTYRDREGLRMFKMKVGTPVVIGEVLYHPLSGYTDQQLLVRQNAANDLVYLDEENSREVLLTSFTPAEPNWWNAPGRPCEQEGQTLEKRGTHSGPSGVFRDVLDIRYRSFGCADIGVTYEQFGDSIGLMRRIITTFGGPVVFDLIEAKIGNVSINALPNGRFTVSLDDVATLDTLSVKLRLETLPAALLKLAFATSQEYDIALRDADGNTLYQWSADRIFAQALHERLVGGEWEVTVQVPRPKDATIYTVHGWITTIGGPLFAATIPSTVSPAY